MVEDLGSDMVIAVTVFGYKLSKNQKYAIVITHSDDIEVTDYCNPPPASASPATIFLILILVGVFSALGLLVAGIAILIVRRFMIGKYGPGTSSSQPASGRRLGNGTEGNDTLGNIGRRLRDGFRIGDLTSSQTIQPSSGTHVRLEDEDMEMPGGDSTVTIHPGRRNNDRRQ